MSMHDTRNVPTIGETQRQVLRRVTSLSRSIRCERAASDEFAEILDLLASLPLPSDEYSLGLPTNRKLAALRRRWRKRCCPV